MMANSVLDSGDRGIILGVSRGIGRKGVPSVYFISNSSLFLFFL